MNLIDVRHYVGVTKKAMNILSEEGVIPEEHFAQKESTAEDANMDKTLTFDLSRITKTPMTNVSVDAENCFDRISHVILMLIWYVLLNDWMLVTMFLEVIGHMCLYQRTGYGDSQTFVGGKELPLPFQGKGQGSGGAPAAWIHHSTVAILAYLRQGFSSSFTNPFTREMFGSMGRLFVDDTNLYITLDTDYMDPTLLYEELLEETQLATTTWGSLLVAGGGSAKQKKCYWQPILYESNDGLWYYVEEVDIQLLVPQPGDVSVPIAQLSPFDLAKELGVKECVGVAGGSHDQLESMRDKFSQWVSKIRNSHLQPGYAWLAYRLQIWPGIRYSLGTLTNDMEDIADLFQDIYYNLLPSLGVVRSFRKLLRTVHQAFGGVGLWHMPTEQLIERLTMLLQHYQRDSTLGRKFRAMTRWLQLEIGTCFSPFSVSYDTWSPLATHCWHKMLWRTIQWSGIELYIDSVQIPYPRENDICIMEYVFQQGCTGDDLLSINRCRNALHLLFLSDIVTADGLHFERSLISRNGNTPIESSYDFPVSLPTMLDWRRWEAFWTRVSGPSNSTYRFLGRWIHPSHRKWRWYYDEGCDQIQYKIDSSTFLLYNRSGIGRTRSQRTYVRSSVERNQQMSLGMPTSIHTITEDSVLRLYTGPSLSSPPQSPADFWSFLASWGGTWMWRDVVNSAAAPSDLQWLTMAIRSNTALWCTDGSHDPVSAPEISGAGWIIYDTVTEHYLSGSFFERSDQASSYRGEMIGNLALHIMCCALEQFYVLPKCSNKLFCDNEVTLKESRRSRRRVPPKKACSDVIRHMRSLKESLAMQFDYIDVDAHADERQQWERLTIAQQLNCRCDLLAKRAVSTAISLGSAIPQRFLFPNEGVAVFVNGWKQTSDLSSSVRFEVGKREARRVLTQPYTVGGQLKQAPLSCEQFDEIDWESRDRALTHGDMYKTWLTKQTSNFCGSGVQVARYAGHTSGISSMELIQDCCPNCGMKGERASHLCCCPDPDRTRLYKEQVEDLETWMIKAYGHPELVYFLPKYLLLRGTREFSSLGTMSSDMMKVARSQDVIGWRHLTEGKLSRLILPMQKSYLVTTPSRISGEAWVKQLIHRILHTTHSQWIYRNVSLHHKRNGALATQRSKHLLNEIELILLTPEDELPDDCRYLLDIDINTLRKRPVEEQENYVYVAKAAIRAGQRTHAGRASRLRSKNRRVSTRQKLGLDEVETQLRQTRTPFSQSERERRSLLGASTFSRSRPHPSSTIANQGSNKRLRKPD